MTVEAGDQAPDFTLESTAGGEVTLSETLASGPTAVLLNRGHWCSYCAEQLITFSDLSYDLWRNHGTDILPIAGDPVSLLVEMRDRFDLGLQLLSDPDLEVASTYTGIEDNPKHGRIPISGAFIVDEEGTVQYAQIAETPDDRTYANYVRHFISNDMSQPYQD